MSALIKVFLVLLLFITIDTITFAQAQVSIYTDLGSIQTSDGIFLKSSIQGQYQYKKYTLSSGIQSSIIGYNPKVISGIQVNLGRKFQLISLPLKVQALYIWNGSGELIREHNLGVFLQLIQPKFNMEFGTHFRTLYYSKQAITDYSLQYQTSIHENWNMIYALEYFLKPQKHNWNIGLGVTNRDYFMINQETNPLFYIKGNYCIKKNFELFLESWYKSAGALNASVHYFGFFVRTGIKWQIDTKK